MPSSFKILIGMMLVTVIVIGAVAGFFLEIRSVNGQANDIAEQVQRERQRQHRSESLQEMLENNTQEINELDAYVVGVEGTPAFLSMIEEIGSTSGATVATRSVETTDEGRGEGEELLTMSISITGGWSEVYRTIALIETLPLKITISAFNVTSRETEAGAEWDATVRLNVVKLAPTT